MLTTSAAEEHKCGSCQKSQSQLSHALKKCGKCKQSYYCSRECQKADWKVHKGVCRSGEPGPSVSVSAPCLISKPFTALQNGTWLRGRPEKDVYRLLIDTYRMRREDSYKLQGDVEEGCIYSGAGPASGLRVFRNFLQKIIDLDAARPSDKKLFPNWWSSENFHECMQMAETDKDLAIMYAVEKGNIQDYYKQIDMPMQLRMFGEALDGTKAGGQSGRAMLQMRVAMETGSTPGYASMLSVGA